MELGRIDRMNDRPPYRQIADHLRAAIDAGQLRPGDRLPSEAELKEHYRVARMTARQAIQELRAEGRVVAEHGRGVFVRQPPPVRRLASDRFARSHREAGKAAFLAEAERSGFRPRVDQIEVTRGDAPAFVRERLQMDAGPVLSRSRRYFADDRPVEIAVSYLPLEIAEGTAIAEIDTGPGGVYARLEEAGHILDRFVEEVSARMPTAEERNRLELQPGVPVLVVIRTAYDTWPHSPAAQNALSLSTADARTATAPGAYTLSRTGRAPWPASPSARSRATTDRPTHPVRSARGSPRQ